MEAKLDWDLITDELMEGGIIPVIGPELLQIEVDGKTRDFRQWLAKNLADSIELPIEGLESSLHPMQEVMSRYYQNGDYRSCMPYQKVKSLIASENWSIPEPLIQLTDITSFRFYLTTLWEPMLEEALKKKYGPVRILENNLTKQPEDIDKFMQRSAQEQFLPEYIELLYQDQAPITLYYLYGRPSRLKSYALSEDDVLLANLMLQHSSYKPDRLIDYLSDRRLLILGCNFPNWLARFFLSLASPDPKNPSTQPVFVISDKTCQTDPNLVGFLRRQDAIVANESTTEEFVRKLHYHWKSKCAVSHKTGGEHPFEKNAIFISYASADDEAVKILSTEIRDMGLPVWLDKCKLSPGDDWADKITNNIRNSSIFMPVISENSLCGEADRFFRKEWDLALSVSETRERSLKIMPIGLATRMYDDPRIPVPFRELQWLDGTEGHLNDSSLGYIIKVFHTLKRS